MLSLSTNIIERCAVMYDVLFKLFVLILGFTLSYLFCKPFKISNKTKRKVLKELRINSQKERGE